MVQHVALAHLRRAALRPAPGARQDRGHQCRAAHRLARRLRFSRADAGVAQVRQPAASRAIPRFFRHADARPGVRAGGRRPGGDAECPRTPAHDEPDEGLMPIYEPILGRYVSVRVGGAACRVFFEEAGQGVPLLCLHTAGADSRQWRHVLNDEEITRRFRVIAFDLPYHGRSTPPDNWWLARYRLTMKSYVETIRAVWKTLELERPVVMGCSMGGAIALKVAVDYQNELTGIVGLESTAHAPGRYNDFLHHPAIHGGELCASYTLGLCAPSSPEVAKRENWWYYSQGGPGVYAGDVHFYSFDWDAREEIKRIDTRKCRVSLLTGEYDYSCTPAMTEAVAASIPGARMTIMKGMGHFPMIENYAAFRPFLLSELGFMTKK